jgi:hypothetical protein
MTGRPLGQIGAHRPVAAQCIGSAVLLQSGSPSHGRWQV